MNNNEFAKYIPVSARMAAPKIPILNDHNNEFIEASGLVLTKNVPIIEAIIPIALITKGSITNEVVDTLSTPTNIAKDIVAIKDPAYDSNKSAPMPATSPTLSPTLSAMVAGFLGSSSGIPASTFPTKSAPTSAAFV